MQERDAVKLIRSPGCGVLNSNTELNKFDCQLLRKLEGRILASRRMNRERDAERRWGLMNPIRSPCSPL